jgi:serine/threonine-protein phosphatase 2A regulatory subunit A
LLTVTDLVAIAEELSPEESKAYFLQTLKSMVADKSWRVRYMIADNFVKASWQRWSRLAGISRHS